MIREQVLKDFPTWTPEKQLSEYQGYKNLQGFSPFSDVDYELMEMIMKNPNVEASIECKDGVCTFLESTEKSGQEASTESETVESEVITESEPEVAEKNPEVSEEVILTEQEIAEKKSEPDDQDSKTEVNDNDK